MGRNPRPSPPLPLPPTPGDPSSGGDVRFLLISMQTEFPPQQATPVPLKPLHRQTVSLGCQQAVGTVSRRAEGSREALGGFNR